MSERARDRSIVFRFVSDVTERFRTAVKRSGVVSTLPVGTRGETALDEAAPSALERSFATSSVGRAVSSIAPPGWVLSGASNARFTSTGAKVGRYVESSFTYQWLTTEPEPVVVVIDLRETRTVGSVIDAGNRTIESLVAVASTSTVGTVTSSLTSVVRKRPIPFLCSLVLFGTTVSFLEFALTTPLNIPLLGGHLVIAVLATTGLRSRRRLKDVLETKLVQYLSAAFEPPPIPDEHESGQNESRAKADHDPHDTTEIDP